MAHEIKKVRFSEKLEKLVDEEGMFFEGKRFKSIIADSLGGSSSQSDAVSKSTSRLLEEAYKLEANAYEITSSHVHDSKQEYDSTPYSVTVTAILDKTQ